MCPGEYYNKRPDTRTKLKQIVKRTPSMTQWFKNTLSLHLNARGRFDIGFGPGQGKKMTLTGGLVGGLVVDARGRPFTLPRDVADRRSLMRKWLWDMGG